MKQLQSYLRGQWQTGEGDDISLFNPTSEEAVATVKRATQLGEALAHGREVGGPKLRDMSFAQRGELLKAMSKVIYEAREELIALAILNGGNTRGDAKFDIDGANAVLAAYAEIAETLGDKKHLLDGEASLLMSGGKIRAQHIRVPRHGVAVHINAFNFPAWGMIGKAAVSLLAGMPVVSKPATSTSWVAHRIAELLVEKEVLPEGCFQLLMGPAGDLLDHVQSQDVIAFTGSATTGAKIRTHGEVIAQGVRVNVEADSLNAAIIGPDVETGSELFDLVVRDCLTEITQKAGQKCTATRRILVPEALLEDLRERLVDGLEERASTMGNPAEKANRMGPLATASQLRDGRAGVALLAESAKLVRGNPERSEFNGVESGKGFFLEPVLFEATAEAALDSGSAFHGTEVFGPVATLLPYDGTASRAATIIGHGRGSLVSTVYSDDREFLSDAVANVAPHLGRMVVAGEKIANASFAPGLVFPGCNHGGPGRAGSGEELGGISGMGLYMQRVAIQGAGAQLSRLVGKN
jgi:oxepin-CoA hydrolase/3-oxo-5,6-dehydrosuberyl-CoA semialdehyde dehydrogenase